MSSKNLQALISSLTPSEKRYIRQYASRNPENGKSNYLRLFEQYLADEENKALKKRPSARPAAVSYLYYFLLKSLRSFHGETTADIRIREYLTSTDILLQKRLYDAGYHELNQAEKLAQKHERYSMLLDILLLRCNILIEHQPQHVRAKLDEQIGKINTCVHRLSEHVFFRNTENYAFTLLRQFYTIRKQEILEEMQRFTHSPLFVRPEHPPCFASFLLFHNVRAILAISSSRFGDAASEYSIMLDAWEKASERKEEEVMQYRKMLSNYMTVCHALSDFGTMAKLLKKLKEIPTKNAEEEAEQFQNVYYQELLFRLNTDQFDEIDSFLDQLKAGIAKYKSKINHARLLAFYHNIAVAWFLLEEWEKCGYWLEKIITAGKADHRKDLQFSARLLRLIIYAETRDSDLIEYEFINVERYLRHHKAWYKYEATVLKFLKKIIPAEKSEVKLALKQFKEQLHISGEGRNSASLPGLSEIKLWIDRRLTGCSVRELLKKQNTE